MPYLSGFYTGILSVITTRSTLVSQIHFYGIAVQGRDNNLVL